MRKKGIIVAVLGIGLVVGYIIYSLTALAQVSCEVCIEFRGGKQCRTASGANKEEAQRTATDVACSLLSSGMADGIACTNTPPTSIACAAR